MEKRIPAIHPLLVAFFPILSLYASNVALFPFKDILRPLAFAMLGTVLVWLFFWLVVRSRSGASVGASLAIIAFFSYDYVWQPVRHWFLTSSIRFWVMPALGGTTYLAWTTLLVLALIVLAAWKLRNRPRITEAFNVAALALVVMAGVRIATWQSRGNRALGATLPPVSKVAAASHIKNLPDVYYIVLDGYARGDAIMDNFGFSNEPFLEKLGSLGFKVLRKSHSNYSQTELSLGATLNYEYLSTLLKGVDPKSSDRGPVDHALNDNRVMAFFKALGYQTVAITSGFPALEPKADVRLSNTTGMTLFESSLLESTPVSSTGAPMSHSFDSHRNRLRNCFTFLDEMGEQGTKPRFVFAHILLPHPPFVFKADGSPRNEGNFGIWDGSEYLAHGGTWQSYRQGYIEQLQFLNGQVLAHLAPIVSRPDVVVIVQGDHGSRGKMDFELESNTVMTEPFRNLNAWYAPPSVTSRLYETVSSVNTFRVLFNGLYGQNLPLLPDRSYYNPHARPYDWTDVTSRVEPNKVPQNNVGSR